MRIYFARHGESKANILHVHSNRGYVHPLTEKGRGQAAVLAQKLGGTPVSRLFTSPLMRAVQTGEILSAALGVPYEVTDALREYDCGILEGRGDEAAWEMHRALWREWENHGRWDARLEGGESYKEIKDRFVPFVEALLEEYQDAAAHVVLVGHGGLYRCMLPLVLTNADAFFSAGHSFGYTEYYVAESGTDGLIWVEQRGTDVTP